MNFVKIMLPLVLVVVVGLAGCKKEDTKPSFELRFTCISENPYLIEVDGNTDIISGNTFRNYILEKGTYAWKVTQQSGYLIYPTIKDGTVNLDQDKEIVFP